MRTAQNFFFLVKLIRGELLEENYSPTTASNFIATAINTHLFPLP